MNSSACARRTPGAFAGGVGAHMGDAYGAERYVAGRENHPLARRRRAPRRRRAVRCHTPRRRGGGTAPSCITPVRSSAARSSPSRGRWDRGRGGGVGGKQPILLCAPARAVEALTATRLRHPVRVSTPSGPNPGSTDIGDNQRSTETAALEFAVPHPISLYQNAVVAPNSQVT